MINPENLIRSIGDSPLPPVEDWSPDYCGELDLQIKADGSWIYAGTPLTRARMRLLFSRVIKKEGDSYFLVTPVEKVSIKVEWQPFVIIDFEILERAGKQIFQFVDNCENQVELVESCQMQLSRFQGQDLPVVRIRRNLFAGFSRNCYYRLLQQANVTSHGEGQRVFIASNGLKFNLGDYQEA